MPKWTKRQRVRDPSPDVCPPSPSPPSRRKQTFDIHPSRKSTKQPSSRRYPPTETITNPEQLRDEDAYLTGNVHNPHLNDYLSNTATNPHFNDDYLNSNNDLNSNFRRMAPSDGDSLEEFSPTYDEYRDAEVDIEGDMQTILPFVKDICFNPDTSLMDVFGTLVNHDSHIPLTTSDDHITLHRSSPSPLSTPIMSPETPHTPETPIVFTPPETEEEPETSQRFTRSQTKPPTNNVKIKQSSTPIKAPTKKSKIQSKPLNPPIKESPDTRAGRKRKVEPTKKSRDVTPPKYSTSYNNENYNNNQYLAIKADERSDSPPPPSPSNELEKSFKEKMIDFVEQYETYERPGKLKRLRLTNFMCHDNFDEEWHRQVNYITADNGAGKSAILVALQLVFGAKASTTMRSTSVKDLIQYQKYLSTIEITLTNDGLLDIEKYGKEIGIIRTILWNGTSRYQIRTADGKGKRSLSRKELELVKATLQIMVDNPAMILNQEASRNFLRTTDPQALYSYFYRGLNLEHCEVLLERSKDDIKSAKMALKTKHKLLEELQEKAKIFKSEYDAVLSLENGQERAQNLNLEYHWAIVSQVEEELSTLEGKYGDVVQKCRNLEEQFKTISDMQNSLETNQESSKSKLKKMKKDLQNKREDLEHKNREFHTTRQELGTAKAKLTSISKVINEKSMKVQSIEAEVARIREESDAKYQERMRQIQEQRRSLESQKVLAKARLAEARALKEEAYTKFDRCKQNQVEWCEKSEDIQFRIREKKHELMNIQKKQSSKYNRYGSEMVKLMQEIEKMVKKKQFKEPPIGPQSACYTVKEEYREYAPLIEHILGSTLFQIRVGHVQDKVLLQELMKKIYGKKSQPDILYHPMKSKERYNLLNVKKDSGYDTVLDALDIIDDDPVVVNWLADSNGVEKILLFKSEEEACNIMKEARRVPKGCSIAYSLNFKRIHADPRFRSMVINPVKTKTTYIQTSSHLGNDEMVKNEIADLEAEAKEILTVLENAKREAKLAKEADRNVDRKVKEAQSELNNLETLLQGLDDTVAQGPDIASYEEDAEELKQSIRQNKIEEKNLGIHIESLKPKYEVVEKEKALLEELIQNKESDIQAVENQGDYAKRVNDLRIKLKNVNEELSNQNTIKHSVGKKLEQVRSSKNKTVELAAAKGRRVNTNRDPSSIKEELIFLEEMLHANRHKITEKGRIKDEWERAQDVADSIEQDIRVAGKLIDTLNPAIVSQERRFEKKKYDFGNTLQASFQSLVSSRNFGGKLLIDHTERNLMFWVCPDTNSEDRAKAYKKNLENFMLYKKRMKDYISGLSGGERSFSTICFMVSMWKTMEAPFYILDEFDVFMDPANRKASQMILNAHTRSQPEAQFIFITPLKLDSIIYPENCKMLRLYPPIRDSTQTAEEEAANKARALKMAEEKEKNGSVQRKRGRYSLAETSNFVSQKDDGRSDYFDYSKPITQPSTRRLPIMC